MEQEMKYEYEALKAEFRNTWQGMTESRFNYSLGQLNTLAGWTNNLQDYIDNIIRPVELVLAARELMRQI